jgi:hypothetical protein
MRAALAILLAVLISAPDAAGPASQYSDVRQALDLGRTRDDALFDAFNQSYELPVADPIERAQIITEFRRAVLLVRDKYNIGEFGMTEHDLTKALAPFRGQIAFVAEARFNPLHTYPAPPKYEMYISTGPQTKPLVAKAVRRDPVYPPGLGFGTAFPGVRLEGTFERIHIERAPAPMLTVTDEKADILWQASIDLTRYR